MLLINSSFVGGLGAARKTASFIKHIRNVNYILFTDFASIEKLELVGLKPDRVVVVPKNCSDEEVYSSVKESLLPIKYDAMISFGWRTYVPADAIERQKPAVTVDGGWPERLESYPSPFWKDVYSQLKVYCLTNYFYAPELDELVKHRTKVPYQWIFHPFSEDEIRWHIELRQKLKNGKISPPYHKQGQATIFLDMNQDYVEPNQGMFTGGWLKPRQLDECRGFITRLIVELDSVREPLSLLLHQNIALQFEPVIKKCRKLNVVSFPSLSPEGHHILRASCDLVLLRATRNVGAAQVALSNTPAMHMICPTSDDYMGELSSCKIAEKMGIAESVNHEMVSLADAIMNYLNSSKSIEVSNLAQEKALSFWKSKGPDSLLDLVLEKAELKRK